MSESTVPILNKEQLRRAQFGLVDSLDAIFEEFVYSKKRPYDPKRGSITKRPEGFIFCSGAFTDSIQTWGDKAMDISLGAKLRPEVRKRVEDHCCEGSIGGLAITPWKHANVALICAEDRLSIAKVWIAFIPLDKLPVIDINNTELRNE